MLVVTWSATRLIIALLVATATLQAQDRPSSARPAVSASGRLRAESWDWFDRGPEGEYAYGHVLARAGLTQRIAAWQWRLEGAGVLLAGLPTDGVPPATTGQLGLWAAYCGANDSRKCPSAPATVADISLAWQVRPHVGLEVYGAIARGGDVIGRIYGGHRDGRFPYVESSVTR